MPFIHNLRPADDLAQARRREGEGPPEPGHVARRLDLEGVQVEVGQGEQLLAAGEFAEVGRRAGK